MRVVLVFAAFTAFAAASTGVEKDGANTQLRSLLDALLKEETKKYDDVKDNNENASETRGLDEKVESQQMTDESDKNENTETLPEERGLDSDLEIQYADDGDAQETRGLEENTTGQQTEEARSLDNLKDAEPGDAYVNEAEADLDVQDRTVGGTYGTWYGWPASSRGVRDGWSNAILIPAYSRTLRTGRIVQWRFYASGKGLIFLQVWRPVARRPGLYFSLVASTSHYVSKVGIQYRNVNVYVRTGDKIGFYFPGSSIIPFSGWECTSYRTLYVKSPTKVLRGSTFRFLFKQTGWKPCRRYSFAARLVTGPVCTGLTPVGYPPNNYASGTLDLWSNAMYIPNPTKTIPANGYIHEWRFYAKRRCVYIYLQVFKRVSRSRYTLVSQTPYLVRSLGINTVKTRLAVRRGYTIGFTFPSLSVIPFLGSEKCSYSFRGLYVKSPVIRLGYTYTFKPMQTGWRPCRKYSFGAFMSVISKKRELDENEMEKGDADAANEELSIAV